MTIGCAGGGGPELDSPATATIAEPTADITTDGQVLRVGGDPGAQTEDSSARAKDDGSTFTMYRSGRHVVDTPLPDGYPAPTAPGAIEIKRYPPVRRAEVARSDDPDGWLFGWVGGKSAGFWPLFRHIEGRGIPMTAPVETDMPGSAAGAGEANEREWKMAFLYRRAELGATGPADKGVIVRDAPAATVLSMGISGKSQADSAQQSAAQLRAWLRSHPEWREGGPIGVRVLNYNDPFTSPQWSEVQIGIERAPTRPG